MPDVIDVVRNYVFPVVVIVVVAFVLVRASRLFIHGVVKALMDREATEGTAQELSAVELQKRMDTLDGLGANVLQFFIVIIAGLMVLRSFGLDIGPAVAGLGVVGVAVGFGAQNLVRDYLNGALILIENQFSKGDVIRAAGVSGTVEDFSLRRTTLRDLDGVVHTVPNGEILVASNLTRVWSRINLDVMVAYGTDIDRATAVVDEVGRSMAGRPGLEAARPGGTTRRSRGRARGVRRDPQDPGHRAGAGPVGRRGRAPEAAARGVHGARHRDPAAAARHPLPRAVERARRLPAARRGAWSSPRESTRRLAAIELRGDC